MISNLGQNKRREAPVKISDSANDTREFKDHPLDSEESQERLRKLMNWRRQARTAHAENRSQMAIDEDYYDGIQFEADDIAILDERGQPANYWNVIKNTVNWLLGTERRTRFDYRVLPRKKQDSKNAKTKTKIIKYIQDTNRGDYARSLAFGDCVKAGVGWLETGVRDNDGEEPIYYRHENWRNMWFDNLGREPDTSDWRYVLREKWVDLDIAQAMFPKRAEELEGQSTSVNSLYPYQPDDITIQDDASEFDVESDVNALLGGAFDGFRERVKLIEMWYRTPEDVQVMHTGEESPFGALHGAIYRKGQPDHEFLVGNGYASLHDAKKMVIRCAIWCGSIYLQDELSPYNHNRFPFIPIFCYRFARNGMPYGIIRDLRSPQDDLNKRKNKALFLLSSNRFIYETGAINDPQKFYDEINRPDGMAEVNQNKMGAVKEISGAQVAIEHIELARDDERFIDAISGVTAQNKGQSKQQLSGKAINALQNQGDTTSGIYFDNYMYAFGQAGEILLSLCEQFKDKQETLRITGDQQIDEFVDLNTPNPETGEIENSLIKSKADFIVSRQDFRENIRQSMLESLGELIKNLSQTGGKGAEAAFDMLDMYVDLMDELPNKEELVARIRKLNGQRDPADEMSEEEKAQAAQQDQAKAQQQQKVQQMQEEAMQLDLRLKAVEIKGKDAKADRDKTEAIAKALAGFKEAMEAAGTVAVAPELVEAADHLMQEARQLFGESQQEPQPQQMQQLQQDPQGGM